MRILVTGHRGNVGVPVARQLADLGYDITGFDRVDGHDLLDPGQVKDAAAGCLSKCLAEDLCAGFTARTGIATVALRPVWVWQPGQYRQIEEQWRAEPESEYEPYWEYGAFVDVRDVATAVELALKVSVTGHHRALLCAADIAATGPSLDMAARLAPDVTTRDTARYRADPWRALVDCPAAQAVLGWRPRYRWSGRGQRPEPGLRA